MTRWPECSWKGCRLAGVWMLDGEDPVLTFNACDPHALAFLRIADLAQPGIVTRISKAQEVVPVGDLS